LISTQSAMAFTASTLASGVQGFVTLVSLARAHWWLELNWTTL